jgi:putative flippase GtrA
MARSRLFRFLIVGGVNTAFSYGVYALLVFVGVNYAAASLAALIAAVLFGFKTTGTLVFGNSENRRLGRFVVCWVAIYFVNVTIIGKMIDFGFDRFMAGALPIPAIAPLSYALQKVFVFHRGDSNR